MPSPSSSRRPRFSEPQSFSVLEGSGKWYCNVCTSPMLAQHKSMSAQAALKHEKAEAHKQKVHERDTWNPQPDVDAWDPNAIVEDLFETRVSERMQLVDQLKDSIPFWLQQISAAERGETLRWEEYWDAQDEKKDDLPEWNTPMPDWALEPIEDQERSSGTAHAQLSEESVSHEAEGDARADDENHIYAGPDRGGYMFVEKFAKMNSVGAERKKLLHTFYKISMEEKLERIEELLNILRSNDPS
ncbi:hypothetical protein DFH11DRAFT_1558899 [Phellopilus nigrolimitatus]|nr:hypothetical protein DFH11DRAFT_1558899 [Phellopilus nigrolimitatus]